MIRPLQNLSRSKHFEIFEAEDLVSGPKILKILKTDYEELINIFRRESQVLSWLEHPGIPTVEPEGYFPFPSEDKPIVHCLVMEKVEGQDLETWIQEHQLTSPTLILKWLKELIQILDLIHKNNLFHGDIKPSNIIRKSNGQIVLIDFGAVKQSIQVIDGLEEPAILTPGYAPPEQFTRQAVPQSDFYALGRTFVHLITGQHPIDLETDGQLIWRQYLPPQFPDLLADFMDDLIAPNVGDRPSSTEESLQRIDQIFHILLVSPNPRSIASLISSDPQHKEIKHPFTSVWNHYKILILIISLLSPIIWIVFASKSQFKPHSEVPITTGETTLLPGEVALQKQKGMQAVAAEDYGDAIKHFKALLDLAQQPNDPEARIFLNNARIGKQKSYTIAVLLPLGCSSNNVKHIRLISVGFLDATLNILRGAEEAQDEINRRGDIKQVPLKLALACSEDQDDAALAAKEIIKNPEILGVIGPTARKASQAVEKLFCSAMIVNVSPTSDSRELDSCDQYTFRMLPNDALVAKTLVKYMLTVQKHRKVAIYYNSKNLHSQSLREEFETLLSANKGKTLARFDFTEPKFNPQKSIELSKAKQVEVLVLLPDAYALDKALEVVNVNQKNMPILAGANIFELKTLQKAGWNSVGMVIAAPFCHSNMENARQWRYALTYESIYTLKEALNHNPSRSGIRNAILSPGFQSKGMCGPVKFLPSGDRNTPVQLMTIHPGQLSGMGYDFTPISTGVLSEMERIIDTD